MVVLFHWYYVSQVMRKLSWMLKVANTQLIHFCVLGAAYLMAMSASIIPFLVPNPCFSLFFTVVLCKCNFLFWLHSELDEGVKVLEKTQTSTCVHTIVHFCKCISKCTPNIFFNVIIRKLRIVFYLCSPRADWIMEKKLDLAV